MVDRKKQKKLSRPMLKNGSKLPDG